ncbi:rubrerythrin [Mesoterricola silvestris]|uniref:Rubrerythrin n=1 Tax=Mesoterricola silvestris TaxID=2927979 RepID=A0AA48GIY1_9BACT|nr:rubrerythrin family protein [Mesoterricola silvestris]BDU73826.1 rubrerythrin [Mesoterricola silvestris]
MEFKDSQTAKNLLKAFAGESQARNRYTFAAGIARAEGLEHVAAIFEETAGNEREHARLFYAHLAKLAPSALEITAGYPVVAGDTAAQLRAAVSGENEEWSALYPDFARIAKEEGFNDVARTFEWIAKVEKEHEARFQRLLDHVVNGTVFQRGEKIYWRCMECGHIHEGPAAPKMCPVCMKPQGWFEPVGEKF